MISKIMPYQIFLFSNNPFLKTIYHYTADTLGIREDECFVVEDSTVGIEAAYRAGMSIAGLKDDRFGFDQSKADYHIDSISDILRYL